MINHDHIHNLLLQDIENRKDLEERRQAIENFSLFIDASVKYAVNQDPQPGGALTDDEIDEILGGDA